MGRRAVIDVTIPAAVLDRLDELLIGTLTEATVGLYAALDSALGVLEETRIERLTDTGPAVASFQVWVPSVVTLTNVRASLDTVNLRLGTSYIVRSNANADAPLQETRIAPPPYWT